MNSLSWDSSQSLSYVSRIEGSLKVHTNTGDYYKIIYVIE